MVSSEIQNYINQARRVGMSDVGIKQSLLNSGWPESDINQALDMSRQNQQGVEEKEKEKENRILMSILAYFGILVLIPYFNEDARRDEFTKFHIKQGLALFVVEIAFFIFSIILSFLGIFLVLIGFGISVLAIIGIVNVATGKMKPVPIVGSYANKFNI